MPFYDNYAEHRPTKLGEWLARAEAASRWRKIVHLLPEQGDGWVLEIGPGRGYVAQWLKKETNLRYVGLDANVKIVQQLPGEGIVGWAPPLPFREDEFLVAYASHVLEHMVNYREALRLLEEMRRVVIPGGLVCCVTPDFRASPTLFWNGDYSHAFPTTPRRLLQMYQDVGLEIVALYAASGPLLGWRAYLVSALARLLPTWIINDGAWANRGFVKMWYSLKTTFLRSVFIVGRKI